VVREQTEVGGDRQFAMPVGKTILDLCGGTGAWSRPYVEANYDVRIIDIRNGQDVRLYKPPKNVHGILAAPPCTHFAVSGARWWKGKGEQALLDGLSLVDACLRIIMVSKPKWWALENPVGRLSYFLGRPRLVFQPYEYGDPWTKKTCVWGEFNIPKKNPVKPIGQWTGRSDTLGLVDHFEYLPPDWVHKLPPSPNRPVLRSITPPGFARAFFEANP